MENTKEDSDTIGNVPSCMQTKNITKTNLSNVTHATSSGTASQIA